MPGAEVRPRSTSAWRRKLGEFASSFIGQSSRRHNITSLPEQLLEQVSTGANGNAGGIGDFQSNPMHSDPNSKLEGKESEGKGEDEDEDEGDAAAPAPAPAPAATPAPTVPPVAAAAAAAAAAAPPAPPPYTAAGHLVALAALNTNVIRPGWSTIMAHLEAQKGPWKRDPRYIQSKLAQMGVDELIALNQGSIDGVLRALLEDQSTVTAFQQSVFKQALAGQHPSMNPDDEGSSAEEDGRRWWWCCRCSATEDECSELPGGDTSTETDDTSTETFSETADGDEPQDVLQLKQRRKRTKKHKDRLLHHVSATPVVQMPTSTMGASQGNQLILSRIRGFWEKNSLAEGQLRELEEKYAISAGVLQAQLQLPTPAAGVAEGDFVALHAHAWQFVKCIVTVGCSSSHPFAPAAAAGPENEAINMAALHEVLVPKLRGLFSAAMHGTLTEVYNLPDPVCTKLCMIMDQSIFAPVCEHNQGTTRSPLVSESSRAVI